MHRDRLPGPCARAAAERQGETPGGPSNRRIFAQGKNTRAKWHGYNPAGPSASFNDERLNKMSRIYETLAEKEKSAIENAPPPTTNLPVVAEQQLPAASDNGWEDTASELDSQFIRGTLLKFADWRWTKGKDGDELEKGTQLVALGTTAAWVKWHDNKPVQYLKREPGTKLPERDEMSDRDQSLWQLGPDGKPRDPWQNTRFVYLLDPVSCEMLTFSTSSIWGTLCRR